MGIWIELGIFGLFFVFAFWQMHDVRKAQAQAQTRQQRALEKERAKAAAADSATPATDLAKQDARGPGESKSV